MSFLKPTIKLTRLQAKRFLLAHHSLWPPRKLIGKQGVIEFIRSVGTIQFDPINVVGRNADLVLQSRMHDYKPEMLHELLYEDRKLLDGFDKVRLHLRDGGLAFFSSDAGIACAPSTAKFRIRP